MRQADSVLLNKKCVPDHPEIIISMNLLDVIDESTDPIYDVKCSSN